MSHPAPQRWIFCLLASLAVSLSWGHATETENLGLRVLPAGKPGSVAVDGSLEGWNLAGGIFACRDVENQREQYGVWIHAMYDPDNLYLLARWADPTPLNNPGQTISDYGWEGDCLQVRTIVDGQEGTVNCWKGRDGADVIQQSVRGREGPISGVDVKPQGARQGFRVDADGRGYTQAIAIPWKLLTPAGKAPPAGGSFTITVEPNFTIGERGRLTVKDIFKAGVPPNREFTYLNPQCWGVATLERTGDVKPARLRLADDREFPVAMKDGKPEIDWTGLVREKKIEGFLPVTFTMPGDGYISLNILDAGGKPVCQLLRGAFYPQGTHTVQWDGLTTPGAKIPGEPVKPGAYTWEAIWHPGIHVQLKGWAGNSGSEPWENGIASNWGGDQAGPAACAAAGDIVLLGWASAEAGSALIACDLEGKKLWGNKRGGIAGASLIAVSGGEAYVLDDIAFGAQKRIYRLSLKDAAYISWEGTSSTDLNLETLWKDVPDAPMEKDGKTFTSPRGMTVAGDKLLLSFTDANLVAVLDAKSGKLLGRHKVEAPGAIKTGPTGEAYVISKGTDLLAFDPANGSAKSVIGGLGNAAALAVGPDGSFYVGLGAPDNQIQVFTPAGKPAHAIGRKGGRALIGKWQQDGMAFIHDLALDAKGQLWVTEKDEMPKRFSVWDAKTGKFINEFFGPTDYGAVGGAINPRDPTLMVGQGCEWKIDPATGKASCLGVITRDERMGNSRFGVGGNGRLYLATSTYWLWLNAVGTNTVSIFERVGDGDYRLRTKLIPPDPKKNQKDVVVWSDENDDGEEQPGEMSRYSVDLGGWFTGWYMPMTQDLTFYGTTWQVPVTGYTACGAPRYDLDKAVKLPVPDDWKERGGMGAQRGHGSPDGRLMLYNGVYGVAESIFDCYDIQSGKLLWTYPNTYVGVHGSHQAGPPEPGLIRGAFDIVGAVKLPDPAGNCWLIATNFGEWHLLTEKGFYLTRLFEPDVMKAKWPKAEPGALLDTVPSGGGGEDFGGAVIETDGGKVFIQAGKTGFWNAEIIGLGNVKAMTGAKIQVTEKDVETARTFHEKGLQESAGTVRYSLKRFAPDFTGTLADFKDIEPVAFKKQDEAAVRAVASWDDNLLYLAWEVRDNSPWTNGAKDATQLYMGGDTVDFQLGVDPDAPADRETAGEGDMRVSIGNFQGKPTAVLYRKVSAEKKPKVFSSGVVASYPMDYVDVIPDAKVEVKTASDHYVVEAAIPLKSLGLEPVNGLKLKGDFGVTHGDSAGQRTRLRTYWSNQRTGIVDDAVFELQMEPRNWGELTFQE